MNERIKELAKQAEFSENELHIQGDNFQMFAELIVKECVQFCGDPDSIRAIAMKQYFGVDDEKVS